MRMNLGKHIRTHMRPKIEHILSFYDGVYIFSSYFCLERGLNRV